MKPASENTTVAELAMLVRMLVSALKQYDAAHPMAAKATRLLADRGLLGTGLRQKQEYVQIDAETVLRVARIAQEAERVFGSPEKARSWLSKRSGVLGEVTPLELLGTDAGARDVEAELTRIEWGDFA